jgi:hypothetical protein
VLSALLVGFREAMGAGASSMNRLRKALVMRAYNLRDPGQTLEDFFKAYTYRKVCCLHCLLTDSPSDWC